MKIGFTGTRAGMTDAQRAEVRRLLLDLGGSEFHHGDCVGSDAEAHELARELGYRIVVHPPVVEKWRAFKVGDKVRAADEYIPRNHDIVDETWVLIATPETAEERGRGSGTWATIRYARRIGKWVVVIRPDGTTV